MIHYISFDRLCVWWRQCCVVCGVWCVVAWWPSCGGNAVWCVVCGVASRGGGGNAVWYVRCVNYFMNKSKYIIQGIKYLCTSTHTTHKNLNHALLTNGSRKRTIHCPARTHGTYSSAPNEPHPPRTRPGPGHMPLIAQPAPKRVAPINDFALSLCPLQDDGSK